MLNLEGNKNYDETKKESKMFYVTLNYDETNSDKQEHNEEVEDELRFKIYESIQSIKNNPKVDEKGNVIDSLIHYNILVTFKESAANDEDDLDKTEALKLNEQQLEVTGKRKKKKESNKMDYSKNPNTIAEHNLNILFGHIKNYEITDYKINLYHEAVEEIRTNGIKNIKGQIIYTPSLKYIEIQMKKLERIKREYVTELEKDNSQVQNEDELEL